MVSKALIQFMLVLEIGGGAVFYATPNLFLHGNLDIQPILANEQHLEKVIEHFSNTVKTFQIKHGHAKDHTTKIMYEWLTSKAEMCETTLIKKRKLASKLINRALARYSPVNRKFKRSINPLGYMLAWATGMAGPSEWKDQKIALAHLENAVKNNINETHLLTLTFTEEKTFLDNLASEYEKLLVLEHKNNDEITFYLSLDNKVESMCLKGQALANTLLEQAKDVEDIRSNAGKNLPSEVLFPTIKVFHKIQLLKMKDQVPIFSTIKELETLFQLATCTTVIKDNIIYSTMHIPLLDLNGSNKLEFLDYPIFTKEELKTLRNLQTIALKPLDTFTCAQKDKTINILSSRDLNECASSPNKDIFICTGRSVSYTQNNFLNTCKSLTESIVIQLSENTLLLKSNDKFIDIKCDSLVSEQINITNYSIIHLKSNCRITAKGFSVSKHHRDFKDHLLEDHFKIIPYTDIDLPTLGHVMSIHNNTNFLNHLSNNISHSLDKVRKSDENTQANLKDLGSTVKTHSYINWFLMGLGILGGLSIFLWGAKICILKRRVISNTAGTNTDDH